jgi:uncharacterized protein YndB with AHSA1/START domain
MVKFEISLYVDRPVADVFKYLNDPARMPEWNSNLEEATPSESPVKVGTRIHLRARMLGRKIEGTTEVVEYEPNKRVVHKLDRPFPVKSITTFEAENGGTRLVGASEGQPGGFFKLGEGILTRVLKKQLQAQFETAKELLEAQVLAEKQTKSPNP